MSELTIENRIVTEKSICSEKNEKIAELVSENRIEKNVCCGKNEKIAEKVDELVGENRIEKNVCCGKNEKVDELMIENMIGRGGTSFVYGCKNEKIAAKCITYDKPFSWLELFLSVSPYIVHPNINKSFIKYYNDGIYLYQERAVCNLKEYVLKNHPLPEKTVFSIMKQIISAVAYLHEKGFIHCDLKPSNILIFEGVCYVEHSLNHPFEYTKHPLPSKHPFEHPSLSKYPLKQNNLHNNLSSIHSLEQNTTPNVRLNDFGSSMKYEWKHNFKLNTSKYSAPECLSGLGVWDEKIDVWGLGYILYFLLEGKDLFSNKYSSEMDAFILSHSNTITNEANRTIVKEKIHPEVNIREIDTKEELHIVCQKMLCLRENRISLGDLCQQFSIPFTSYQVEDLSLVKNRIDKQFFNGLSVYDKQDVNKRKLISNIVSQMIYGSKAKPTNLVNQIILFIKIINSIQI